MPPDRRLYEESEWDRLRNELQTHRTDAYAHGALIGRLQQENLDLRERYENRLRALERFKSQATLLGAIGFSILGALAFAVAERFIVHGVP